MYIINNNSSYLLNNYKMGWPDLGLCLITGLTGAPYARRHWAQSSGISRYTLWHKVMAGVECIPVIGGLAALIERVVVLAIPLFSTSTISLKKGSAKENVKRIEDSQSFSPPQTVGNATASEFIACINLKLFTELTQLTEKEAQNFLDRGGCLNIITEEKINEKKISFRREEQEMTGCNSGINRSQVAAAVVRQMGLTVTGVLAGGDSAMNPEADYPSVADPAEMGEEQFQSATNFETTFGKPKLRQVGAAKPLGNEKEIKEAKTYYKNYINDLSHTHFITFGPCGLSAIRRLLERKGSLKGFTITYVPWGDEIAHPPEDRIIKYSIEAYDSFATKLRKCFIVV